MSKILPCLWFDGKAEEAAGFYVSLLPDSRIDRIRRLPMDPPGAAAGSVLSAARSTGSRRRSRWSSTARTRPRSTGCGRGCRTAAPPSSAAGSPTATASPGRSPKVLGEMLSDDPARAKRVAEALFTMVKIDVAGLQAAYEG